MMEHSEPRIPTGQTSVYRHFKSLFDTKENLKPNNTSLIFAIIDYLLSRFHGCGIIKRAKEKDDVSPPVPEFWPCSLEYNSEIRKYEYYGTGLEMSVLLEKKTDSTYSYYYLCLSFNHNPELYYVDDILPTTVPIFSKDTEKKDNFKLQYLDRLVAKAVVDFCRPIIRGRTIPRKFKDFSSLGVKPFFQEEITATVNSPSPRKKRKASNITEYEEYTCPSYYIAMRDSYETMESKPDSLTKLFSLLFHQLVGTKSSLSEQVWPCGLSYKSTIVDLWVDSEGNVSASGKPPAVLNMALLKNQKDFFLSLRFTCNPTKKCVKKLVPALVPSFDRKEFAKEAQKIANIRTWTFAICQKFILEEMEGQTSSGSSVAIRSKERP